MIDAARQAALLVTGLLLTACAAGGQTVPGVEPASAPRAGTVGPRTPALGAEHIDLDRAIALFDRFCIETAPDFRAAHDVALAAGMLRAPTTGTYYHQSIEVSVNVEAVTADVAGCSLAFGGVGAIDADDPRLGALEERAGARRARFLGLRGPSVAGGGPVYGLAVVTRS